jgi:hypothetical protein
MRLPSRGAARACPASEYARICDSLRAYLLDLAYRQIIEEKKCDLLIETPGATSSMSSHSQEL